MEKLSTFLMVLVFLNTTLYLQAQNSPFSVKKKLPGSLVKVPQTVQPLNTVKKGISPSQAHFKPLQTSFSAMKLDSQVFSNPGFNANGQLIFVEGRLPSSARSYGKSITEKEECTEYLTALQQVLEISDPASEFAIVKSGYDEIGMQHIKLEQKFMGIPVYGG